MVGYKRKRQSAYTYANKVARRRVGSRYRSRYYPARTGAPGSMLATRGFRGGYGTSRSEKKVSDLGTGTVQVNTTGSMTPLHIPTLGTDYTNRIGRKTLMKSVYIRGRVLTEAANSGAAVSVNAQMARMILFLDMQPNGVAPAVTDLLNTADPESQLNLNNRDRFKIIKDKQWVFDPYYLNNTATTAAASLSRQTYPFKIYKKCNYETIFNGTNGGTIADITSGALYMFWIGSQAAAVNGDANAILSARVRFIDN